MRIVSSKRVVIRRLSRRLAGLSASAALALLAGCGDTVDPNGTGGVAIELSLGQARAPLDAISVELTGPETMTVELQQSGGFFEATIDELRVGQYTLVALGTGSGQVTYFGRLAGVQVRANETTDANVPLGEFVTIVDEIFPGPTTSFTLPVSFAAVASATQYVVEYDTDASFPNPIRTDALSGTDARVTVSDVGTYFMRVRAANATVSVDQAAPSEPVSVDVVADAVAGSDQGSAAAITPGATTDVNVYPANEENWFAVDLLQNQLVFITVTTESLNLPSPLNPVVRLLDAGGTEVGSNDDAGAGTVESRLAGILVPSDGTYNVVVTSSGGGSVGHFELNVVILGDQLVKIQTALEDPFIDALIGSVEDTDPGVRSGFARALTGIADGDLGEVEAGVADARTALESASNADDLETVGVLLLVVDFAEDLLPT